MPNGCPSIPARIIAYPARRNGSMPLGLARTQLTGGAMTSVKTKQIVLAAAVFGMASKPPRWVPFRPTSLACMTQRAMCGNGWKTAGMTTIRAHRQMVRFGRGVIADGVCCAAGPGSTAKSSPVAPPATTAVLTSVTAASAFGWCVVCRPHPEPLYTDALISVALLCCSLAFALPRSGRDFFGWFPSSCFTAIKLSRHTGRDCRYPEHREVNLARPPWPLGSGIPYWNDGVFLNLMAVKLLLGNRCLTSSSLFVD